MTNRRAASETDGEMSRNVQTWPIEFLAGLTGGIAMAIVGGILGALMFRKQGMAGLVGPLVGMLLGFPLGVGGGMGFIASRMRGHKRPWLGFMGAVLGIVLILLLAEPTGLNQNTTLLLAVTILTSCLSAWAALNLPGLLARGER